MKKFIRSAAVFVMTLVIAGSSFNAIAEAATARAVCEKHTYCISHTGKNCTFTDKNKDGICDNCDGHKIYKKSKKNNGKKNSVKISKSHHSQKHNKHHH